MTDTAAVTDGSHKPVIIHFLETLTVAVGTSAMGSSRVFSHGDELEVTHQVRAASRDRNGDSWLSWLDEGQDEYVRGGRVLCRRGRWPEDQLRLVPGSFEWEDARRRAIAEALSVKDPTERRAARQRVDERFGPSVPTSRTLAEVGPQDGRAAE
jgi:hypothetical protein